MSGARPALPRTMLRVVFPAVVVLGTCCTAVAHVGDPEQPRGTTLAWSGDWWLWTLIGISGWLYARGVRRLWHASARNAGVTTLQVSAFAAGWLALAGALLSPLDELGGVLFAAHMVQHEILMLVAAPLLLLGRPLGPYLWALPRTWRRPVAQLARELALPNAVRFLTRPLPAWIIGAAALWLWHVPVFFDAALVNNGVHTLQHLSFFASAVFFWWSIAGRRHGSDMGSRAGVALLSVATTALHTTLLGFLLTFSGSVWYRAYGTDALAWGLTPLEDQQLGGLIMWVPGGFVYLAAALMLTAEWAGMRAGLPARSAIEPVDQLR